MKGKLLIISSLIIFLGISCSKSLPVDEVRKEFDVNVFAEDGICSKTSINGKTLSWTAGDSLGVFVRGFQTNRKFTYSGGSSFLGTFIQTGKYSKNTECYAYYPYQNNTSSEVISSVLNSIQTAPFDASQDVMVADIVTNVEYDEENLEDINFKFNNHLFSLLKITITNTSDSLQAETIRNITIKTLDEVSLCGAYEFDIAQGISSSANFTGSLSNEVTIKYPYSNRPTLGFEKQHIIYAVVKPGSTSSLQVTICTSGHKGTARSNSVSIDYPKGTVVSFPTIDICKLSDLKPQILFDYDGSFIGDSITSVWYSKDTQYFISNNYINKGISGQTSGQMLSRFTKDIVNQRPRCVAILAGTNDIAQNQGYISNEGIMKNLSDMAELAAAAGIHAFLCTVLPVHHYGWRPVIKDDKGNVLDPMTVIQDLNLKIKAYCDANPSYCTYVDYYSQWVNDTNTGPKSGVTYDGVHPTLDGCQLMESIIDPYIQSLK